MAHELRVRASVCVLAETSRAATAPSPSPKPLPEPASAGTSLGLGTQHSFRSSSSSSLRALEVAAPCAVADLICIGDMTTNPNNVISFGAGAGGVGPTVFGAAGAAQLWVSGWTEWHSMWFSVFRKSSVYFR